MQKIYQGELLQVIQSDLSKQEILERLENYHFSDIADALEQTATEKRLYIYSVLGLEKTAEIFSFYEYVEDYIKELSPEYAADLLECMHSDDAVDMLNRLFVLQVETLFLDHERISIQHVLLNGQHRVLPTY